MRDDPGRTIKPDMMIAEAKAEDFDALVLPGGVINPDALRTDPDAVALVQAFAAAGKPVAAICHGPWLLVEADVLKGRRATGWKSIRTDLRNAGAEVSDGKGGARWPDHHRPGARGRRGVHRGADRRRRAKLNRLAIFLL